MRIAVAALCVLALTGSAEARYLRSGEASPCDVKLPKTIVHPNVPFTVRYVSKAEMERTCRGGADAGVIDILGCTYKAADGSWPVLIAMTLPQDQVACVVQYEMAHMPPNYWADPKMELPKTIDWLSDQKKASR